MECAAASQDPDLPWVKLDHVSLRFSAPVSVDQAMLAVQGLVVERYDLSGFRYDADTRTATWTLANPPAGDLLRVELTGGPSAQGPTSFHSLLETLPGDSNGDGRVNALDLVEVRRRVNTRPGSVSGAGYRVFSDIDGSGTINALDLALVKRSLNQTLPPPPAPTAFADGVTIRRVVDEVGSQGSDAA